MPSKQSMDLYDHPEYYEIAFSFRDIKREVDVFESCFRRFSKIPVRRVLDVGCGPAPHLEELSRRGYEYVGLDDSRAMLAFAKQRARTLRAGATFVNSDMRHFSLNYKVDFAFTMLGSLHGEATDEILSHFFSVANALRPGGLYFLDWCVDFQWADSSRDDQSWTMEKEGIRVDVKFVRDAVLDRGAQTCRHKILADVNDKGKRIHLETVDVNRTIFPQEFLMLVEKSKQFEFIGWWNNWNLKEPIEKAKHIDRPITLIRRLGWQKGAVRGNAD